jgi:hypothetical protein
MAEDPKTQAAQTQPDAATSKDERKRSTIQFPYGALSDAIEVVNAIFKEGGQRGTPDQVAAWTGHKVVDSGAYRYKLSTARIFGLIAVTAEFISLTELGSQIVDPQRERQAKAEAFLKVPLYQKLYENFRGKILPQGAALENEMVQLGVSPKQKDKARQAFFRSAEQAGFFSNGRDRLIMPTGVHLQSPPDDGQQHDRPNGARGNSFTPPPYVAPPSSDLHPFIRGLLDTLPKPDSVWPEEKQDQWLATAKNIFKLIYKEN